MELPQPETKIPEIIACETRGTKDRRLAEKNGSIRKSLVILDANNDKLVCDLAEHTREKVICSISGLPCPRGSVLGDLKQWEEVPLAIMLYIEEVLGSKGSCNVTIEDNTVIAKRNIAFTEGEKEAIRDTLPKDWRVEWKEREFQLIPPMTRAQFGWPRPHRERRRPDIYGDQRVSNYELRAVAGAPFEQEEEALYA